MPPAEVAPIAAQSPPPTPTQGAAPEVESIASLPPEPDHPTTVAGMLRRMDEAFMRFRTAAFQFPLARMDEHIAEDAWTRKQMLAHVAAWHDLTANRLIKLINEGDTPEPGRDTDAVNAQVARQAVGKTAGEVLQDLDATYNRLRRQVQRLTDVQLADHDAWAAYVIGANTYGHYAEHWQDIYIPEPETGAGGRR